MSRVPARTSSKRARRWRAVAALVLGVAPWCMACKSQGDKSAPEQKASLENAERKWVIGVSQSNLGEPYRVQMNADLAREAKAYPRFELVFKDAQNDSLRQRAQVNELASREVDLLIISPKESAPLTAPVAAVYQAGTPVIVLDRRVDGDKFTAFVGPDNRQIGRAAGRWVAEHLGGKGTLVELKGLMTSSPARERHEGFWQGIDREKHPGIVVAFEADTQWLEPNARREMDAALARLERIDLVFAHNDPGAHGAYLAAKAASRQDEMQFVGIDALPHEGVRYVREGILDVTFSYPTGAKEALALADKILRGEPVPRQVTLETRRFESSNVAQGGAAVSL